jgi:DNA invertase Pin-like site-specific DNA recombinase
MRTLIYARSSAQHGDSIGAQEDVCRRWAEEHDHLIVGTFSDDGVSGAKQADQRPGLSLALAALEDGKANALLVHRLDRVARALHVQEVILERVWKASARVIAVDGGEIIQDDPTDPMRTFCRQVLGAASQLERGMIVARMQEGKRRQREAGFYSGGAIPFGYELQDDGQLAPVEADLQTASEIAAMREAGLTLRAIADHLNAEKIKAPRGGSWYAQTVARAARVA